MMCLQTYTSSFFTYIFKVGKPVGNTIILILMHLAGSLSRIITDPQELCVQPLLRLFHYPPTNHQLFSFFFSLWRYFIWDWENSFSLPPQCLSPQQGLRVGDQPAWGLCCHTQLPVVWRGGRLLPLWFCWGNLLPPALKCTCTEMYTHTCMLCILVSRISSGIRQKKSSVSGRHDIRQTT